MTRRVTAKTSILEIGIELLEVRPAVVRRVKVPAGVTLAGLHRVVQSAMGWTDSHLHEFDVGGARYGPPDPDGDADGVGDERRVTLSRLVRRGDRIDYVYDFGDGSTHRLAVDEVLAARPGVSYPRCVSGRQACPPEDVGGPEGYEELVVAIADPAHPEHEQYRHWVGESFDPAAFDLDEVNEALAGQAWTPLAAPST